MLRIVCIVFVFELFSLTEATESGIVGGKVSKPHSRPYMASLQFNHHHSCGGILIREDFVLTVAHCRGRQPMKVVLGAHNLNKEERSQQRIDVASCHPYPDYTGNFDYDIMLLKLKNNATLNKYVKTIGLPRKNGKIPANINCVVAGWGVTQPNGSSSNVLKEATEKIQFNHECKNIWKNYFSDKHMLCTRFQKSKGGICQGDSGGPLICNSKPQGLIAFTFKPDCNNSKYPHVFTKIHFFLPWIKKIMQA